MEMESFDYLGFAHRFLGIKKFILYGKVVGKNCCWKKMPGIAHVAVSLGLSIFLYKITHGRFSIKHAVIFTINSFVGPDIFGFIDYRSELYVFFHGMGWFIAAIPLTFVWSVYTRYHLSWKPFKVWKRDPNKEYVITIPEVFCLVAAGGIFHQFMDLIGHPSYITYMGEANVPWGAVWFGGNNWFTHDWM